LFFASLRLIRWDEAFAASHKRYASRKQRPLKPLEAVGVMMNKLLRLFWALSNNRTFYDPQLLLDSRPSA
jgi:3-phosphoglycerate kinase